jgi:SNF2 family DNA or RNA helicase
MIYKPKLHHRRGIAAVIKHACMGLLLDRGLGKTGIMLAGFSLLRAEHIVRRMLVVTGLRPAYEVWPDERNKWDDFHDLSMNVLHGPHKDALLKKKAAIDVINPEGLPWLTDKVMEGNTLPWDVLCVDESTSFKHTETQRFTLLKPLLPFFKRRYILTGNPSPNGLLDLFGQIYILDLGHSLSQRITYYRLNYFNKIDEHRWVIKPGAEEEIYKKVKPYVLRMEAKDYVTLPPLVGSATGDEPATTMVKLPPAARLIYDNMEKELIAKVEDGTIVAANAAVATSKCLQVCNGSIYGNDKKGRFLHEAKVDALEEMIDEVKGVPALVAYQWKPDLELLLKRFPGTPHIGGGVSPTRFREIKQEWNKGNLPILFCQPISVAKGLNLQGTRANGIWFGPTWDLEIYDQLNSRIWRVGQEFPVFINHILAEKTIESVVMDSLKAKHASSARLLTALKTYFRGHR